MKKEKIIVVGIATTAQGSTFDCEIMSEKIVKPNKTSFLKKYHNFNYAPVKILKEERGVIPPKYNKKRWK